MNKLIITADDFGMCDSVNKAIIDSINAGVVLSTNVMVNMECADDAKRLKAFGDKISVGLHWTLTVGKPLLQADLVSSIIDGKGEFLDAKTLKDALKRGKVDKTQLKNELKAQYDRFVDLYGIPSYWNTHENIHININLFRFFVDLASELGIKKMRCHDRINVKCSDGSNVKNNLIRKIKMIIIKRWNKYARKKGMLMPNGVLVFANYTDRYSIRDFYYNIHWNKQERIVEMYVHPSIDEDCEYFGSITEGRVREYKMCNDVELVEFLSKNGIRITHFGDV